MALLDSSFESRLSSSDKWLVSNARDIKPILAIVNRVIWEWYREQQHDMERPVFTIRKWGLLSFTVRVRHLEDILTFIFGSPSGRG